MPRRLAAGLLAASVLAVFLPALRNGFVWDDAQYVLENPHVAGGLTPAGARWALTSLEAGNWHPLTWLSHMLDVELFGLRPRGHHLVSVLFHAANAALLFLLLEGLTGATWRSLLAAALFGVHPLRVESVAWIAERKDVLSTFFAFAALLAHLRAVRRPSPLRRAAVVLLFAAGLAAKPMVVTLPLLMLLLDAWPLGRLGAPSWRRPVTEKLPLLALSAAAGAAALAAQAGAGALAPFSLEARASNAALGYLRYLAKALAPVRLAAFYPHAEVALALRQTLAALLCLGLATALAVLGRRRRPWLLVGWLWFVVGLLPVIGLVQVGGQAFADRYTYLPLVGIFVAAAWGAAELAAGGPVRRAAAAVLASAVLLALTAATRAQLVHWRDTVALFTRAVETVPGNWLAHYNLGRHYQKEGRTDRAELHYRAAIEARPDYEKALNNLGTIAAERGRSAEAIALFRAALRARPGFEDALVNLGAELVKLGQEAEAEACFLRALERSPDLHEAREPLAELLLRQRRFSEAEAQFVEALRRRPESNRARNWLGVALAGQGRYAEAVARFQEVLRSDPTDADARANLARALALRAR